jgi:serine/threonine-protein kinase
MAPEQAQARPVDARADIYSLGAVLYAMLTGRPPFQKATELATIMAQINEPPPPIATVAPGTVLPRGLEALIMKCLAKTPEQRFGSMEEVVSALRAIAGNPATTSDSVRAPAPMVTGSPGLLGGTPAMGIEAAPASRSRSWWLLAGAGAALACAGLAVVGFTPVRAPRVTAPEPPQVAIVPQAPAPLPPPVSTATLHVETDPPGAKVKEEGDTMCELTPCDIVYRGAVADPGYEHLLVFLKSGYRLERKIVKGTATPVSVKLTKAR